MLAGKKVQEQRGCEKVKSIVAVANIIKLLSVDDHLKLRIDKPVTQMFRLQNPTFPPEVDQ